MENHDRKRFLEIMTALAEDCSSTITDAGLELKFAALQEYSIQDVEKAVIKIMKSNIYTKMPTTGKIVEAIIGHPEDEAEIQATLVMKAIRDTGHYEEPIFDDPITALLVKERYGWDNLCQLEISQNERFIQGFKSAYNAFARKKITELPKISVDSDPGLKYLE